jgi:hypothetical protein
VGEGDQADGDTTGGKRHRNLSILTGIVGAVLGFLGAVSIAPYDRMDGITSAFVALFVFGPIGAVAGAFIGAKLAMLGRAKPPGVEDATAQASSGSETAGTPTRNALKSLAILVAAVAVVGGSYAFYAYQTATPWLRPGNVALEFEVRLPAGTPMPPASGVKAELQTPLNTMPADIDPNLFRLDGDQPVIAGRVWLHYRTNSRQIEVKIPGRMDRVYQIKLKDTPPHTPHLGAWQRHPDGSEIRYRAKWPGQG